MSAEPSVEASGASLDASRTCRALHSSWMGLQEVDVSVQSWLGTGTTQRQKAWEPRGKKGSTGRALGVSFHNNSEEN